MAQHQRISTYLNQKAVDDVFFSIFPAAKTLGPHPRWRPPETHRGDAGAVGDLCHQFQVSADDGGSNMFQLDHH
jgi:hypothetical protein